MINLKKTTFLEEGVTLVFGKVKHYVSAHNQGSALLNLLGGILMVFW